MTNPQQQAIGEGRGIDAERLRYFVLARFCCPGAATARRQLARYVGDHLSAPAWRERFDATLADLVERGWVEGTSGTDSGRRALAAYLRMGELPEGIDWKAMTTYLMARAFDRIPDAAERRRLDSADRLRGTTLAVVHDLDLEAPSLARAVDALIWRELGVDSTEPLSLAGVRRAVLSRLFGTPPNMPWTKQATRGAAAAVGASGPSALREGIIRAWLASWNAPSDKRVGTQPMAPRARPSEPPEGAPPPREALRAFADTVTRVAKNPSIARLGRRVYISALYANLDLPMSLDDFKQALGDAHRAGVLQLDRADDDVEPSDLLLASETHYLHTVFHFLVLPE
jgi:hypothetical protein